MNIFEISLMTLMTLIYAIQISALAPDGGYNLETTIRRLMKHLLTDEMGRKCNLSGQHGKMAFGQSEMMNVVFG